MNSGRLATAAMVACLASMLTSIVDAADWPTKPVRLIVPYEPGGPTDASARAINTKVGNALGQPVLIENRPGAGSIVGSELVAKSPPDGQTILLFTAANTMNITLIPNLPYDMVKDFSPITMLVRLPSIVVVHPSLPARSVGELIAYARANPGKLSYASAGTGTPMHLAGELLKSMANLDIVHVPYKGSAPALTDLMTGRVELSLIGSSPALLSLIQAGKLRAIATTNESRSPLLPDLPTVSESGLAGFQSEGWHGLAAPARTPRAVINRLYKEIDTVLKDPETRATLLKNGADPAGMPPDEFSKIIQSEIQKWAKVVQASKLTAN